MATLTISPSLQVRGVDGKDTSVNTEGWSPAFIEYMLAYAWGVRMQRCTASAKDPEKALDDMFAAQVAGKVPSAGGGRGPSLDEDGQILHEYLVKKGFKGALKELDQRVIKFGAAILQQKGVAPAAALAQATEELELTVELIKASPTFAAMKSLKASLAKGLTLD